MAALMDIQVWKRFDWRFDSTNESGVFFASLAKMANQQILRNFEFPEPSPLQQKKVAKLWNSAEHAG